MKVDENSNKSPPADTTPKDTGKNPADEATPESESNMFAEQFENKVVEVGDSILPWVAGLVNNMFYEPNLKKVEEIQGDIKVPSNLYIETPRVNPEIWNKADQTKRNIDINLQHILKRQGEAATLLAQLVDKTMIEKAEATEPDVKEEKNQLAFKLFEVLSLLGAAAKDTNDGRRKNLKYAVSDYALRKQLAEVPKLVEGVPPTYLFGDNYK